MSCTASAIPSVLASCGERVFGSLPGTGGCGCGCGGVAEVVFGALPGLARMGVIRPDLSGLGGAWRGADVSLNTLSAPLRKVGYRCSGGARGARGASWALVGLDLGWGGPVGLRSRQLPSDDLSHSEERELEQENRDLDALFDSVLGELFPVPDVSCTPLLAPSARGACGDAMLGDDDSCGPYACDVQKELPDMEALLDRELPMTFDDYRDSATTICETHLVNVLRAGWAMLQENIDLVRWALCWGLGRGVGGELVRVVLGFSFGSATETVRFLLLDSDGDRSRPTASVPDDRIGTWDIPGFDWINIFAKADSWQVLTGVWCCARNPDRVCVAITVAAVLLHELTHYFGLTGNDPVDRKPTECFAAYRVHTALQWALHRRYGALTEDWYSRPNDGTESNTAKPCCSDRVDAPETFAPLPKDIEDATTTCFDVTDCDDIAGDCGDVPCG